MTVGISEKDNEKKSIWRILYSNELLEAGSPDETIAYPNSQSLYMDGKNKG